MKWVRVCPYCGHINPADAFQCENDRIDLAAIPVTQMIRCPSPECGYEDNPAEDIECRRCGVLLNSRPAPRPESTNTPAGTVREASFMLCFDFGNIPIRDQLAIGRDPGFSSIAHHISDLHNVGRRHAVVRIVNGRCTVTDMNSTNKVKVNGKVITPEIPFSLQSGDSINFSSQLQARVEQSRG